MSQLRALKLVLFLAAALTAPGSALAAPPPNDAFAAAQELTGRVTSVDGLNKDATKEAGEPDHAGEPGGASVWYRWTAPATGRAFISTCTSGFDTVLAVYTGEAVGALAEVAANDDSCGLQSQVSFATSEGVTYRIAIDGMDGETGVLALALRLSPANDDFENAVTLSDDEGSAEGTNVGSSRQTGEPDYLANSVWYRWTAPSSGWATFETCGSGFDTVLAAFTGNDVDALTLVRYSDDACGLASRVSFEASAGIVYVIVVDGYGTGDFQVSWNRNPPPPEPPYPESYPEIAGLAREGETLTVAEGQWYGTPPFSFTYAWGRCDSGYTRCDFIAGATTRTYLLTGSDVGHYMFVRVTASNAAGSAWEYSDPTPLVRAAGPSNVTTPTISGTAIVGESLTTSDGRWTGPTPIRFAYQWQACDAAGSACVNLEGQNLSFIELSPAHIGKRLRVVVTATNVDGSRSATSDASSPVVVRRVVRQVRCVVPKLRGKSLKQAKGRIRQAHCKTGRVTRRYSSAVPRGRVLSQTPKAGARMKQGARINLVVSRGRKP